MSSQRVEHKLFSLYYTVSSFCWIALLIRLGILLPLVGKKFLPGGIADYFITLQTACCCLDLLAYVTGRVRFDLKRFVYNFLTRMFVSHCVIYQYPKVARTEFFSLLILAWGLEEFIRYIYFSYKLRSLNRTRVPAVLHFVYFNNFMILFPLRVVSELCLTFLSLKYIEDERYKHLVRVILVLYLPLAYLYLISMYGRSTVQKKLRSGHYKTE